MAKSKHKSGDGKRSSNCESIVISSDKFTNFIGQNHEPAKGNSSSALEAHFFQSVHLEAARSPKAG